MKASNIFLFGIIFGLVWDIVSDIARGKTFGFDGTYNYWEVFVLIFFIVLWYSIDNKLNKTYKVTKWDE